MNLKKTLLAVIPVILVTFLIYSCRKDYLTGEEINPRVKWAKDYFTRSLLPKEGNAVGRNLLQSSELLTQTSNQTNKKITIWERAMEGRTSRFDFVEIPLKYRTKITSLLSVKDENKSSPQVADKGVLKASFDRLVIYKNKKGEIHQSIISFVPTKAYLLRHNGDISHNRINKLDKDFDGTLIYRGWDDKLLFALVIKQGKAVQKLSLSNQIRFKKTAFREENCVEIEIYHWYQNCYYSGDNTEPDYCEEPYSEYGGSYFVCTEEDPCADPTNFGSGDCGGGDGGIDDSPPLPPKEIKNSVNDTCIKKQVENAISANTTIAQMLRNEFEGGVPLYDPEIEFRDTTNLPANTDGEEQRLGVLSFEIRLNQNTLPTYSNEYILATIYHEILHAYLETNFVKDATGNFVIGDHHNIIADHYVTLLTGALLIHSPGLSEREAWALAWGGLQNTTFYNSKITAAERAEINLINSRHRNKNAADKLGTYCR